MVARPVSSTVGVGHCKCASRGVWTRGKSKVRFWVARPVSSTVGVGHCKCASGGVWTRGKSKVVQIARRGELIMTRGSHGVRGWGEEPRKRVVLHTHGCSILVTTYS